MLVVETQQQHAIHISNSSSRRQRRRRRRRQFVFITNITIMLCFCWRAGGCSPSSTTATATSRIVAAAFLSRTARRRTTPTARDYWAARRSLFSSSSSSSSSTTPSIRIRSGRCHPLLARLSSSTITTATQRTAEPDDVNDNSIDEEDRVYMLQAVECAAMGRGHTFPNPAVGCVLVETRRQTNRDDNSNEQQQSQSSSTTTTTTKTIIGRGFHPRAGYPHAEVFALLEAAGHVEDGVEAAQAVIDHHHHNSNNNNNDDNLLLQKIEQLTQQYASEGGPEALFRDCLVASSNSSSDENDDTTKATTTTTTTAYVTLEPCCHRGQTPPCAVALQLARVDRVVVGLRDPNPRVDGGGVRLLEDAGVVVDTVGTTDGNTPSLLHDRCTALVTEFVKRIAPRSNWQDALQGKHRRALRAHANRLQSQGRLETVSWGGGSRSSSNKNNKSIPGDDADTAAAQLALPPPEWLEHADGVLWQSELVLLRLNRAVAKKRDTKWLGERIAEQLHAHVAQVKGHSVLLYRPGLPQPALDLEQIMADDKKKKEEKKLQKSSNRKNRNKQDGDDDEEADDDR